MTLYNHNTMNQPSPWTVRELLITRCLASNLSEVYRSFYIIMILQNAAGSENQYPLQADRADGWRNNNQTYFRQTKARCHFLNRTDGSWKIAQLSMDRGTVLKTHRQTNGTLYSSNLYPQTVSFCQQTRTAERERYIFSLNLQKSVTEVSWDKRDM
jgi:hypothetical protein